MSTYDKYEKVVTDTEHLAKKVANKAEDLAEDFS